MKITPILDRILVRYIEPKSQSRIILIQSKEQKDAEGLAHMGEILSVGSKVKNLKAGDKVMWEHWVGVDMHFPKEKVFMMKQEDIMAVVF